jgi:hypothetical protein
MVQREQGVRVYHPRRWKRGDLRPPVALESGRIPQFTGGTMSKNVLFTLFEKIFFSRRGQNALLFICFLLFCLSTLSLWIFSRVFVEISAKRRYLRSFVSVLCVTVGLTKNKLLLSRFEKLDFVINTTQGEKVEFDVDDTEGEKTKAINVTGPDGANVLGSRRLYRKNKGRGGGGEKPTDNNQAAPESDGAANE